MPEQELLHTTSRARIAFDRQAPVFDQLYANDTIIQYKRQRVREHIEHFLQPSSLLLELNAGTAEDAIYFASKGHRVHATDISPIMQQVALEKIRSKKLEDEISYDICSFTELGNLPVPVTYDHIYSNFAGLNCTDQLATVLDAFNTLLKPKGCVTLVLLPKFCLWEFLLLFKGKFKTAFRRFSGKKGAAAHIEGVQFRCWYYNPSFILKHLKETFTVLSSEGLCTIVPPSYLEGFAEKHPVLFDRLKKWEQLYKSRWPWKNTGDYYIITLQKK